MEQSGGNGANEPGGERRTAADAGGFRSQPLWLKVLLILSVAALATGIVRCSFEATTPPPAQTEVR